MGNFTNATPAAHASKCAGGLRDVLRDLCLVSGWHLGPYVSEVLGQLRAYEFRRIDQSGPAQLRRLGFERGRCSGCGC